MGTRMEGGTARYKRTVVDEFIRRKAHYRMLVIVEEGFRNQDPNIASEAQRHRSIQPSASPVFDNHLPTLPPSRQLQQLLDALHPKRERQEPNLPC